MRLFNKLKNLFRPSIRIIELEVVDTTPIEPETILALASHPGFLALSRKLRLMQRYYERKLTSEIRSDIREVDQLQAAVFWAGWLERQVLNEVKIQHKRVNRRPEPEEDEAFKAALAALEEIGR
jgi:hypothetical protein